LSFREVAIITSSLEKRPEKAVNCLVRLEELFGSLGTKNSFKIGESKTSGLKDDSLSFSISHETISYLEVRIPLIITFGGKQFFSKFRNKSLILRNEGLIYLLSIGSRTLHRCKSSKIRHNV